MSTCFQRTLGALLITAGVHVCGCAHKEPPRPTPDPATRRTIQSGDVIGAESRYDSYAWLGIPYATPPVSALRWRAPQPPAAWTGTREAVAFGAPCTQYTSPFAGVEGKHANEPAGSEDCLFLNIWTPRFASGQVPSGSARLPVMVWIHGGGNTIGEGGFYHGGNLAATHHLVVVTLNYRLGPFGWLRHAALRGDATDDLDRSGNFGTLDLIRALEWVRDNISAFGGDPGNVTIFGESAGGTNVNSLLLSPRARGLFHRAIVESGGFHMSDVTRAENFSDDAQPGDTNSSNEMLLRLMVNDHSAPDRATAKQRLGAMSPTEIQRYLRGKTNVEILTAYTPMPGAGMIRMPLVFREGVVVPENDPMQLLNRAGGYNEVPVILGTNRDENKLFMFADPTAVRRILWIIPRLRDERQYNLNAEYMAKMWKANGADEPAAAMRATQGPSVYVYRFDWDEEPSVLGADLSVMLGASHGFEIPFVFGHFDLGREGNQIFTKDNQPGRELLSAELMSYWAQFAYAGAPGRGRNGAALEWTPWSNDGPSNPKFIVFDTPAGGGSHMSPDAVTQASVIAAVDADPRLPTQRDKCTIFHALAMWSRGFTDKDYPTAGRNGCAEYPFDKYPWG